MKRTLMTLAQMRYLPAHNCSKQKLKNILANGNKLIVIDYQKGEVQIKEGIFVISDVAILCTLIDSTEDNIVMTVCEAFDFNESTIEIIMDIINFNSAVLVDEAGVLNNVKIVVPNFSEVPRKCMSLDDIINDVRHSKSFLIFNASSPK